VKCCALLAALPALTLLLLRAPAGELLCYTIVVAYNLNRGYPFSSFGGALGWLATATAAARPARHLMPAALRAALRPWAEARC
jgi:hypothetical protein